MRIETSLACIAWTFIGAAALALTITSCKTNVPVFTPADESEMADYAAAIDACKAEARDAGKPNQVKAFDTCWAKKEQGK